MIGVLTEKESKEVLRTNLLGRIGCSSQGTSYIVPINYMYDGTSVIGHSLMGMKVKMMRDNPEVCFEVDEIKSFKNWKSVIAWGTYKEIINAAEKGEVLKAFVEHLMPAKISETAQPPETSETRRHPQAGASLIVYRIVIKKVTGRFERGD